MFAFLSQSWLDQLTTVAGGDQVGPDAVVVQQVVTGGPQGDVAFVLEIDDGRIRARLGRDDRAAVRLTQGWDTAVRIHRGGLSPLDAFRHGLVKVGGDVRHLVDAAASLAALGPATSTLRERTVDA